jgi:hypothetical protein
MARFAEAKEAFLRGFLELENGVPSHDTFSRLSRQVDPVQFGAAFQRFMARFSERLWCKFSESTQRIDGKHESPHAVRTAFQISRAVLPLTRSLPSLK